MARIKLDYVHSFIDARGKLRHVFRRKGHKQRTIKGRPGSQDFMDAYHALLDQTGGPLPVAEIGASKLKAGTIDALVARYLKHEMFTEGLAKATQASRRPVLDSFRQCMTPGGRRYGDNRIGTIHRKNIADAIAGKTPNAQKHWLKTIRHLIVFAIEQGEITSDPTNGIITARPPKTSGHMTWESEQIALYRARHPIGSMARLALELALNIAARRHDVHSIGRQHLKADSLTWRPSKTSRSTGKVLTIKVIPELQAALDAMPHSDAMTFMLNGYGRPFTSSAAFGHRFANWCIEAGQARHVR